MNRNSRRFLSLLMVLAMTLSFLPQKEAQAQGNKNLTIFHTNDIHGRGQGDPAKDKDGNDLEKGIIGYARYKTIIDQVEKDKVLVLDAGDTTHGVNFATLSKGENTIKLMNMVGTDAMAPGNHDFNYGSGNLKELSKDADFPILCSNVFRGSSINDPLEYQASTIVEKNGVKVGIFGMTTPETKYKSNPKNTEGLYIPVSLEENSKIAQRQVDDLKSKGADLIICLAHLGVDETSQVKSTDIAKNVSGIDLIIDGHSHTIMEEGTKVGNTLIAQTGEHFSNIGKVTFELDSDNKIVKEEAQLLHFKDVKETEEDPSVKAQVDMMLSENKEKEDVVIGKSSVKLEGARKDVRTRETNLGNLLTDAMRDVSGADVAITNGGGIRDSIDQGDVTVGEVLTVLPFGNQMTVIKVMGQDIIDALEFGTDGYPNPNGKFPQVSGVTFEILPGTGVENVKVNGKDIDPKREYTLATNDFMAVGGDGYTMFQGKEQVALYESLDEVLQNYIRKLTQRDGSINIKEEGRIRVSDLAVKRIGGKNRIETSVKVAQENYKNADTVILASSKTYVDALTASPYADQLDAPIFLINEDELDDGVKKEIENLKAKNVIVVGGDRAISEEATKDLSGLNVTRIYGDDRYETAARIREALLKVNPNAGKTAILASGETEVDALAAGSLATKIDAPILLARKDQLPEVTKEIVKDLDENYVIGGDRVISDRAVNGLKGLDRIYGKNRYETAVNVSKKANPNMKNFYITGGSSFADAVVISPLLADKDAGLLFVEENQIPDEVKTYLSQEKPSNMTIIGGSRRVSLNVHRDLGSYLAK